MSLKPLEWTDDGLRMLDQRGLPLREEWVLLKSHIEVAQAIREMVIRGAPAIGIAAGLSVELIRQRASGNSVAGHIPIRRPRSLLLVARVVPVVLVGVALAQRA